jgi:lipoteichoic acid synthase
MNRIKELAKKSHLVEFLLVAFIVLTFDLIFILRYGFGVTLSHWLIAFFNVAIVLSVFSFINNNKRRYIAYFIYILIMFTFFVTDSTLYKFKQDVTSIAMLLESGKNTMRIGLKYNPLSAYNIFIWIAIFTFVVVAIRALYKVVKLQPEQKAKHNLVKFIYLSISIIGLSLSPKLINEADALTFDTAADKSLFVQKFGSITYHMRDIVTFTTNAIRPIIYREDYISKINEQVTDTLAPQSDFFGLLEGKNVIMIMCETCEDYAFTETYTPNYYRLKSQSIVFDNFYVAAKTDYTYDSEFKSLTSMMYFQADNFMYSRGTNAYPTALPNMLKRVGYTANSFHNFYGTFFNRNVMHQSLGFESFRAVEEMVIEPGDYWPLDSMMFDQFKDFIVPIQDDPFYSFVITVTPHGPHNKYRNELKEYYDLLDLDPDYVDESLEFRTITAAQMDFDKGLGILLDDLEQKHLLSSTIIVLYSDHKNYSSLPITYEKTPNSDIPYEVDKLPFLIYSNDLEPGINSTLSSHYDIAPTIMDLLGIPYYQDFYHGQSIFLENRLDKPIITSHSNWISLTHMVQFDVVVQGELSDESFLEKKLEIYRTIEFFEMLMFSNYFAYENPFYYEVSVNSESIDEN